MNISNKRKRKSKDLKDKPGINTERWFLNISSQGEGFQKLFNKAMKKQANKYITINNTWED